MELEAIDIVEEVVSRVAAIDIAKASGMVCVRTPHDVRPTSATISGRASLVAAAELGAY